MVSIDTEHTYISLKDIISDFLALGTHYEHISLSCDRNSISRIGESPRAISILKKGLEFHPPPEPLVTLCIMEWEDDFQPLKSNKGQKKGTSSWIKTVTIVPPFGLKDSSIHNTYPVAIGPKGINHEAVERKFKEELLHLSSGSNDLYFDKSTGRMTYVHVELFAALADQPERRGGTYLQLGNSNYHPALGIVVTFCLYRMFSQLAKNVFILSFQFQRVGKSIFPPVQIVVAGKQLVMIYLHFQLQRDTPAIMTPIQQTLFHTG